MTRTLTSLLLCGILSTFVACQGGPDPGPDPGGGNATVSYHHDAVAVLDRYCTGCHVQGGIGPFVLTDYQSARNAAAPIKSAVMSGLMPPWLPSDKSMALRYSRKMRAEDRDLLLRWIDAGTPEGDPSEKPRTDIPPAETGTPPRADLTLDIGQTYMPDMKVTDDYRCFAIDPKLAEDTYVTGGTVLPDNRGIVHHVLVYEILAAGVPALQAKPPAADGQPGYTCFGGPGAGQANTITGWAPGAGGWGHTPEGTALKLSKGSWLVMQVHYNLLNFKGAGDRSTAVLELSHTPPAHQALMMPLANPQQLKIPAGNAHAQQDILIPVSLLEKFVGLPDGDLTIYGNAPHMHVLGTRINTFIENGPTFVEIPRWDFHWQQFYLFQQPYVAHRSDIIHIECDYDNSPAHQPVVNGQKQAPRDVTWGEKTSDEMCLSYLYLTIGNTAK